MQTEIESKGKDIAGASSTIQNVMYCPQHETKNRKTRGIPFSGIHGFIGQGQRLSMDFKDAEENQNCLNFEYPMVLIDAVINPIPA